MATGQLQGALRRLTRWASAGDTTDGQLLERFLARNDEDAFRTLVERHGPMVLGVCRRLLRNNHDAEDAFQATFLVLARKAASVAPRELVGNWLHGVAWRTALKARVALARRQSKEQPMSTEPDSPAPTDPDLHDLGPLLDSELQRLPDATRALLVLCDLEGRSRKEAAGQLGLPEGTLSSRLARARAALAQRLTRRGVALTGATVTMALSHGAASASVPVPLVAATARAACAVAAGETALAGLVPAHVAALSQGVIHAMFMRKLQSVAVWLVATGILGGGVVVTHQAFADKPQPADVPPKKAAADPAPAKEKKPEAAESVQGTITEINADKRTITVTSGPKGQQTDTTYDIAKDAKVLLRDGLVKNEELKEGKLANVAVGRRVTLELSGDKKTVTSITPHSQNISARIKSVDAKKNTITVSHKTTVKGEKGVEEKTLPLSKDVKIWLSDGLKKKEEPKEGKLADLTEGVNAQMQLSVHDNETVLVIRVQGAVVNGSIKGFDAGSNTLTINVKEDGGLVEKEFTLAKDVRINGKPEDLVAGKPVSVVLSVLDGKTAVGVNIQEKTEKPGK